MSLQILPLYLQTNAPSTAVNTKDIENILQNLWSSNNRQILNRSPWDLRLVNISGGYISADAKPVLKVVYQISVPNDVNVRQLRKPRISEMATRMIPLNLLVLPESQVLAQNYRFTHKVPRDLNTEETVKRIVNAWTQVLAKRGRVTEVRVVIISTDDTSTKADQPAKTVMYYLWVDGEVVNPKSTHPADTAKAAEYIWTGVLLRTIVIPGTLTLEGLAQNLNQSVIAEALQRAWQQRNPSM